MTQSLYFRVVPGTLYEHLNISTYNSSPQFHANLTLNGVDLGVKAYPYGFTDYDGNAATQIDLYGIQIVETTFDYNTYISSPNRTITFNVDGHGYIEPAWYSADVPDGFGSQPDLTATLSSAVESSDQKLNFAFTISNVGSGTASGTPTAIYLSPTSVFNKSTATLVDFGDGGPLEPGHSWVTTVSNDNIPAGIQSGSYYAFVVVNYNNSVADANPNNNVSNGVPISISISSPDVTIPISVGASQVLGSLSRTISGTASVTYTFHVSQPYAFYSFLSGGSEFSGTLKAVGGQLQYPTLGRGPGTPDPSGLIDKSTGATGFLYDPLMPGDYSYTVTRSATAPGSSTYTLQIDTGPVTKGNNIYWATDLGQITAGQSLQQTGTLSQIDNKDVYKFTLTQQSTVDFTAIDTRINQDIFFSVLDQNGTQMVGDYAVNPQFYDPGVYYVSIYHVDNVNFWLNNGYTQDTSQPGPEPYLLSIKSQTVVSAGQTLTVPAGKTANGTSVGSG